MPDPLPDVDEWPSLEEVEHEKEVPHEDAHLTLMRATLACACLAFVWGVAPSMAAETKLDTVHIEHLTGVKGDLNEMESPRIVFLHY